MQKFSKNQSLICHIFGLSCVEMYSDWLVDILLFGFEERIPDCYYQFSIWQKNISLKNSVTGKVEGTYTI